MPLTEKIFSKNDLRNTHIHFTGIKGTGMAALVEICHFRGARISGSDVADRFYTDEVLERLHIKPTLFSAENITKDIDLLVYSSAYKIDSNPELIAARKAGVPMLLYTEALGALSRAAYSCGIAGVHGKTTTTGITGMLLKSLDLPVQVLAGSVIPGFADEEKQSSIQTPSGATGSCTLNRGRRFFVAETCEYRRHFMSFCPKKIVLTGVESDHQDYYPTYESIRDAFIDYCLLLPEGGELIYCADDAGACETVAAVKKKRDDIVYTPYGFAAKGPYRLHMGKTEKGRQYFSLLGFDEDFYLRIPGKHTVLNCGAACALALSLCAEHCGRPICEFSGAEKKRLCEKLKEGFASFTGAKRRSEIIDTVGLQNGSVLIMDDYAHHPTALKTTIEGLRSFYPDRFIIVDFMSHTYTRTAALLDDFARSFSAADEVVLHKIYASARESFDGSISGKTLYEAVRRNHNHVSYFEEIFDALDYLFERCTGLKKDVLFITMGAGDNWKLGRLLSEKLSGIPGIQNKNV
ncbi:UDP-N-acetylmuramate--L-alanine ligase [Treponema sp. OMZ 840]|uniref:UDP-N-acetylmuramate--L-alanine ligase n=1 Tax=Treponema sp. OMZ 840 TaxID=244313 RepID=UPI003D8C46E5